MESKLKFLRYWMGMKMLIDVFLTQERLIEFIQ